MAKQDWYPMEKGHTLGTEGSEQGIILQDDEYAQGARITLEQCQYPPFAITCGIYGWMCHTTFASSKDEAMEMLEALKKRLEEICKIIPFSDDPEREARTENVIKEIETFVRTY